MNPAATVALCLGLAAAAQGQPALDWLGEKLDFATPDGRLRVQFSGLADAEFYAFDEPAPGLVFGESALFSPRLALFGELVAGRQWYFLTQFRVDNGFDPGSVPAGDARFDEYFARYTPWTGGELNVQAGKFAANFGGWARRHDSWSNPLITAPSLYEEITVVGDRAAPPGPAAFVARRGQPVQKAKWQPAVWGPSYTTGAAVTGTLGEFDYAFEVKNASVSSRPYAWDAWNHDFDHPTFTGRAGWRPSARWNFGVSGSGGAYLLPDAEATLPAGTGLGDFPQITLGADAAWAHARWQLWGEWMAGRFDVPNVGDADFTGGHLEARYKATAHLFLAARANVLLFGDVPDGVGGETAWDNNLFRLDLGAGWRFNRHWQAKVQYSNVQRGDPSVAGENLFAAQFTVKF